MPMTIMHSDSTRLLRYRFWQRHVLYRAGLLRFSRGGMQGRMQWSEAPSRTNPAALNQTCVV